MNTGWGEHLDTILCCNCICIAMRRVFVLFSVKKKKKKKKNMMSTILRHGLCDIFCIVLITQN